jgi:hypothetical protein
MKLSVIALDYDGTIAKDGRAEPLATEVSDSKKSFETPKSPTCAAR